MEGPLPSTQLGSSRGSDAEPPVGMLAQGRRLSKASHGGPSQQLRPSPIGYASPGPSPGSRGGMGASMYGAAGGGGGGGGGGGNRRGSAEPGDMPPLHPPAGAAAAPAAVHHHGRSRGDGSSPAASREFSDEMDRFMGSSSSRSHQQAAEPDEPAGFRNSQFYVAPLPEGRFGGGGGDSRPASREAKSHSIESRGAGESRGGGGGIKQMDSMGFAYHQLGNVATPKGRSRHA